MLYDSTGIFLIPSWRWSCPQEQKPEKFIERIEKFRKPTWNYPRKKDYFKKKNVKSLENPDWIIRGQRSGTVPECLPSSGKDSGGSAVEMPSEVTPPSPPGEGRTRFSLRVDHSDRRENLTFLKKIGRYLLFWLFKTKLFDWNRWHMTKEWEQIWMSTNSQSKHVLCKNCASSEGKISDMMEIKFSTISVLMNIKHKFRGKPVKDLHLGWFEGFYMLLIIPEGILCSKWVRKAKLSLSTPNSHHCLLG